MVIDYVICLFIITYIEDVLYTLMCIGGYSCLLCALSWISCSINYIDELFFSFCFFSISMLMKAELMIPVGMAIMAMPIRLMMLLNNRPNGVIG